MTINIYTVQHWSKVEREVEPRPEARSAHPTICLGYGGDHPHLLVLGGYGDGLRTLYDVWLLDIQSMKWKEVR